VVKESVVDGPGLRFVVFAQGCNRACPGCHNPDTWDLNGGELATAEGLLEQILSMKLLKGLTLSGGEPFLQASPLAQLGREVKKAGLDLITYTGYTWEELQSLVAAEPAAAELLQISDYIVDGPYRAAERTWDLPFRGSANQRFINVAASLAAGQVVQA
jgi:anaerobic ribonucleoside-triphosphate reductase activating protein